MRENPLGKWLIAFPLFLAMAGCSTPSQMIVDYKIDQLCAKDGGLHVYEREEMPKAVARIAPGKSLLKVGDTHYVDAPSVEIPDSSLGSVSAITRDAIQLYRVSDGKLLAENISYVRTGGNFLGLYHPSVYRCPAEWAKVSVVPAVFVTGGAVK